MKKKLVVLLVVAGLAIAAGTVALAAKPDRPINGSCKNKLLFCLDVWDPVTCDDGKTYSNQCYADRACATGCEPGYPNQ